MNLNIFSLFSSSWAYYRRLLPRLFPVLLSLFLIQFLIIVTEILTRIVRAPELLLALLILLITLSLLSWILSLFIFPLTILLSLSSLSNNQELRFRALLPRAFILLLPFALVITLSTIVILGAFTLLIIPGLIMAVWLSLVMVVLVIEDKRGFDALFRSISLVRGSTTRVFLILFSLTLFLAFLSFLFNLPASLFANWFLSLGVNLEGPLLTYIPQLLILVRVVEGATTLWITIGELLIFPFGLTFTFLLYQRLREAKGDNIPPSHTLLVKLSVVLGTLAALFFLLSQVLTKLPS